ncbi:unnamed protein product [Miscanthus lutarioriparius]|uniref:Protein kinase domain-containing protein n=1 Tax=Miscanthus lutarioriparius TaxID=422564 RepID=A0A811PLZ1_9POAL|nr:unnamed protein product [Miscanthus lutarioriparius]
MEPVPRKRKGAPPACSAARSLQDLASRKRACRGSEPPQSPRRADAAAPAVVMTAPAASGASASAGVFLPGRGLKRKVGCIDSATRIGRRKRLESEYDLGEEIGHGKFGSVRVCRPKAARGEEEFACKALPKNGGDTAHREVEIMQHLSGHPGVVTLRAVFEDADAFYLVMELCHGGRLLDEVAREGKLSERRAANVIKELMAVLKYCHEMGVVHRDVKPENVLLTKAGRLKLADFGLAVRVADGHPWVLFYTECPQKAEFSDLWGTNKTATPMIHRERVRFDYCESLSSESSTDNSEEQDECGIVDALATAITQVRISEPKRTRLFSPANGLLPPSRNTLRT